MVQHAHRAVVRPAPEPSAPTRAGRVPTVVELATVAGNRAMRAVVQRAAVTVHQGGPVRQDIIAELLQILTSAEAQNGLARGGATLTHLQGINQQYNQNNNNGGGGGPDSRNTFGVAGSNYVGVNTISVEGPPGGTYVTSVLKQEPAAIQIGERGKGLHDEMAHIKVYPGVQAVDATQNNCLFCYAVLEDRRYQHGPLRADPWPQLWIHDYLGFRLRRTSADPTDVDYQGFPILKIVTTWGTGYYRVIA